MVAWEYFNRFKAINKKYLPAMGEGDSLASQIVTAVNKLIYKWYNDGDVYDTTVMSGWGNDLSSYANWLAKHFIGAREILDRIYKCYTDDDYELILKDLADLLLDECVLELEVLAVKDGSIYDCEGDYKWSYTDDDEDEY